ncbi:MAG: CRISPR-associated ring nuclease [Oscillochloridaceae bacterium umkhey_bin13]
MDQLLALPTAPPSASPIVMVATLGGQPQVITLALDLLLRQGYPVRELIVLHLSDQNPRYQAALECLARVFGSDRYGAHAVRYRPLPILSAGVPLSDLHTPMALDATLNTCHQLLQQLKQRQQPVHLCVSGGRRLLGMLVLTAAMVHLDHCDRIWHLYSSDEVRAKTHEGAVMHVDAADEVQLLAVPVQPWGQVFAGLRTLANTEALPPLGQRDLLDAAERTRCQQVYDRLTPRRREVLQALVQGLNPQQVAASLTIELNTVSSHQTAIYQECVAAWDLPPQTRLDYRWVREKFAPFFATF